MSAEKSDRDPKDITLVAVTKSFPVEAMYSAIECGLFCLGESRIQETAEKLPQLENRNKATVHLIGHLQKNKARKAVKLYDVIQTVDTLKLAQRISQIAGEFNKIQRIYVQVNTGQDPLKHGFDSDNLIDAIQEISSLDNIIIEGLMMIPPHINMGEKYRNIYSQTRILRDELLAKGMNTCKNLSMGMTRDFEMAIEEGATHIRLGTALFGARP